MDNFYVDFHHGGQFVDLNGTYVGEVAPWKCDGDKWSYFEILGLAKDMGYNEIVGLWYEFGGKLKLLENDFGAIELLNWAKTNGKGHIYLVHPISQPQVIEVPLLAGSLSETNQTTHPNINDQNTHNIQPDQNDQTTHIVQDDQTALIDQNDQTAPIDQNDNDELPEQQTQNGDESDDTALKERFDDSDDDEVLKDGLDEVPIGRGGFVAGQNEQPMDELNFDETVQDKRRNKGGRPKKKKRRGRYKKSKGRPKKAKVDEGTSVVVEEEPLSEDDSLDFGVRELNKEKIVDRGLSDSDYISEELRTDEDLSSDNSDEDIVRKVKYPSFVPPKKYNDYKWELGCLFSTKKEFQEAIANYAVHNGRDLRYLKNEGDRVRVGCKKGCGWVALLTKLKYEDTWQLRKLTDQHSCSREYNIKMFNSSWLGKKLHSTVRTNPTVKITTIQEKVHEKWTIGMSRMQAYRARKTALKLVEGTFKEQFLRLYDYTHELLRSNPNSTIKLTVQPTETQTEQQPGEEYVSRPLLPSFQRLYMCLDACKRSFLLCRPIIGIDGCFLKGNYGGQILAAIGRDPNDQMMPIALAVVEAETKDSWTWFLDLLIEDLGGREVCKQFTFMSDQQKGLLPAMEELLPGVDQRFCVRHLYNNFRKRFPGKQLKEIMWRAAKATYHQAWEREMREMRKVNEDAYKHLLQIPPRFWSKSRFQYNTKCDVLVNNMSECFNSVIIGPRHKPIVTMLEDIRGYLMDRWTTNRTKIEAYNGDVLPRIKKRLEKQTEVSRFFMAR